MAVEREKFDPEELTKCLEHFDLGRIKKIRQFARGSRKSPKAVIVTDRGQFLFKRRARGKDDLARVTFAHQIQLHLAERNFPLPSLITARNEEGSMFVLDNKIYEMFEFVSGGPYDSTAQTTFHAGDILGLYHKLLEDFTSDHTPYLQSYHDAETIRQSIRNIVMWLPIDARPSAGELTRTVKSLDEAYGSCAETVNGLGFNEWARQIIHGDWHPGNMLFSEHRVAAVIDYDSASLQQRTTDLANGALQFSIIAGGADPSKWPHHVDMERFAQFVRGYNSASAGNRASEAELKAVPCLMCEAMIAEAVLPIAATGSFEQMEGFPFLKMIDNKVKWILAHAEELSSTAGE